MNIPEGLESYAEGCIHTDLKVVGFRQRQDRTFPRVFIDIEVEYPNGERLWLLEAPLRGAYNSPNGSLFILQGGTLRIAMVGTSI